MHGHTNIKSTWIKYANIYIENIPQTNFHYSVISFLIYSKNNDEK